MKLIHKYKKLSKKKKIILWSVVGLLVVMMFSCNLSGDVNSSIAAWNKYQGSLDEFVSVFNYAIYLYDTANEVIIDDKDFALAQTLLISLEKRLEQAEQILDDESIAITEFGISLSGLKGRAKTYGELALSNVQGSNKNNRLALVELKGAQKELLEHVKSAGTVEPPPAILDEMNTYLDAQNQFIDEAMDAIESLNGYR